VVYFLATRCRRVRVEFCCVTRSQMLWCYMLVVLATCGADVVVLETRCRVELRCCTRPNAVLHAGSSCNTRADVVVLATRCRVEFRCQPSGSCCCVCCSWPRITMMWRCVVAAAEWRQWPSGGSFVHSKLLLCVLLVLGQELR
jgi:hypothetical protein